jgi:hypothetical protein
MKRFNLRWPVLALLLSIPALVPFSASTAFAQATTTGTVTGTVTDATGAVIPEATITVFDPTTKSTRTTMSNKQGLFILQNIQPGVYDIKATKGGFSTDNISDLVVGVGQQTTANFKMAVGAESTVVEVTASNADLQVMNATTGTTVEPTLVTNLPSIGREVATFLTMQPGVTPGGNDAGTVTDQTTFTLDGGSNSSDMDGTNNVYTANFATSTTGGALGAGPTGVMPMPQDSIEEFKVATTGQTADFNNSSGSQSQAVTKRGRDKVHGTAYEYYLDNDFNANSWQGNFKTANYCGYNNPTAAYCVNATGIPTAGYGGANSYTVKPDFHYSRFGGAAGGPIAPYFLGGKTYIFGDYEGFRYPLSGIYERVVPSYNFLNTGLVDTFNKSQAFSAATLKSIDPRNIGLNPALAAYYSTQLPLAPVSSGGSVGANGTTYSGQFDPNCSQGASSTYCDSNNIIGYYGHVKYPQTSNFGATRLDHDFGAKWHLMLSYRYYKLVRTTTNMVTVCGTAPITSPCNGNISALTSRPQVPWFGVVGLTTNISPSLTNDFHYSYLRNLWQYAGPGDPPQVAGAGAAIEPFGDLTNNVLSPYNVDSQDTRTRTWDGKDNFFSDNVTKLKGDHLIQIGGQFQHNFNYHLRTDNGASINYQPLYLIGDGNGAGNVAFTGTYSATTPCAAGAGIGCAIPTASSQWQRYLAAYYGMVTDTQVLNTYQTVSGLLTLQPASTPYAAHSTIPYYNIYATDTWHIKPSITINAGLSYALEMPPLEKGGYQSMLTDASANPIYIDSYLAQRKAAALLGTVYEPTIGFSLVSSTHRKYSYDPFYAGVSPRVSASWNPKFANKGLNKMFGNGATVIRGGYGRLYGRLNGDVEVLNPLLSPPIIIATQCGYMQSGITGTTPGANVCNQTGFTDKTVARFGATSLGLDGISFPTASALPPGSIANVYRPGVDGPGVATSSPNDPSLRPNDVDSINFSIQRQVSRRSLVEVGYIGRLIHHEFQYMNPNTVPYMMSLGGQSFESAYVAIETLMGCASSSTACANAVKPTTTTVVAKQPFFEAALGGATSTYCMNYNSCTAAVLANQFSNFQTQKVFSLWKGLDNNVNGAGGTGFVFTGAAGGSGRSLMGTAITSTPASYGSAGQIVSGATMATGQGYGNYNGGYASYKISGIHGITLQENLTFSKALGLASVTQSSSSVAAQDSFNLSQQYGKQSFDQKLIFNTFISWDTPWYKTQRGIIGRFAGGWTISPVVTAGTGQPQVCSTNNGTQSFGGDDGVNISDNGESCIFTQRYSGGYHTHRGVLGGPDASGTLNVGTTVHVGGPTAAVNEFKNPAAVYDSTRPVILGLDVKDPAAGTFQGLPYLNLDMSVKKRLVVYKSINLEATGVFANALNHMEFSNPSLSIATPAAFGVTKTQGNTPRQIQMGIRANF